MLSPDLRAFWVMHAGFHMVRFHHEQCTEGTEACLSEYLFAYTQKQLGNLGCRHVGCKGSPDANLL